MAAAQEAEAAAEAAEPAPARTPTPVKLSAPPVAQEPVAAAPPAAASAPAKVPLSVSTSVATLDAIPVPSPKGHAKKTKALEGLEQFLASIQAARRSVPRDNSGVAAR